MVFDRFLLSAAPSPGGPPFDGVYLSPVDFRWLPWPCAVHEESFFYKLRTAGVGLVPVPLISPTDLIHVNFPLSFPVFPFCYLPAKRL